MICYNYNKVRTLDTETKLRKWWRIKIYFVGYCICLSGWIQSGISARSSRSAWIKDGWLTTSLCIDAHKWNYLGILIVALIYIRKSDEDEKRLVVPILFSTKLKENYNDLKLVLEIINYATNRWYIVVLSYF